jgi:hypothetical protein
VRTEKKIYEILHADADLPQRMFRTAAMAPAMLLPPRVFYAARKWLVSRRWYHRLREKALPVPKITQAAGPDEFKA